MIKKILNNVTSCCIVSVSISVGIIRAALMLLNLGNRLFQGNEKILIILAFIPILIQFFAVTLGFCAINKSSSKGQQIGSVLCAIFSIIMFIVVILAELIYTGMTMNPPHLA